MMSYAGTTTRSRSRSARSDGDSYVAPNGSAPAATEYREQGSIDWARLAAFASGVLVGALAGASAALLTTPLNGPETRDLLARRARRARLRAADSWDDWGYDVRRRARRTGRRARQAFRREA